MTDVMWLEDMKKRCDVVHLAICADTLELLPGLWLLGRVGRFAWAILDGVEGSNRQFQVALNTEDCVTLETER
jgi:hypothetical protein